MPNALPDLCAAAVAALAAARPSAAGRVAPAAAMSVARASHTATPLPDGRVLVTGGYAATPGGLPATALSFVYRP